MNSNHKGDSNSTNRGNDRDMSQGDLSRSRVASGSQSDDRSQQWQGQSRSGSQNDMSQSDRSWSSQGSQSSRSDGSER